MVIWVSALPARYANSEWQVLVGCVAPGFILGLSVSDAVWRLNHLPIWVRLARWSSSFGFGDEARCRKGYKSEKYKEITAELPTLLGFADCTTTSSGGDSVLTSAASLHQPML